MSTEERIQAAIADLRNTRFTSLRKAAAFHSVGRSTLQDRINGKPTRQVAHSVSQILSPTQEGMLAQWCLDLEALQIAPNHAQIREMAILILRNNSAVEVLGVNWVRHFLQRNPRVKTKQGRAIDRKRTTWLQKDALKGWFNGLANVISYLNVTSHNY